MKVATIAGNAVRRLLRERSNVFFVFIFPMLLIVFIGVSFGGGFTPALGVVDEAPGDASASLVARLEASDAVAVEIVDSGEALLDRVERGLTEAGLVIPASYGADLAAGIPASLEYIARPSTAGQQIRATVDAAVSEESIVHTAASAVVLSSDVDGTAAMDAAADVRPIAGDVTVEVAVTGTAIFPETLGRFDVGAPQQLLLFTFLTSLAGSAALIQSRRWGVTRRMLATPTSTGEIVTGEAVGRFGVALTQGLFIMVGSLLAFSVDWGNPVGAGAVLLAFSAVGAGAGMLLGSVLDNDEQAGAVGVFLGLGLAALGGCMVPIELFPDTMQRIAHLTPHAWGIDAFTELIRRGAGVGDILLELAVLTGFAVVLLAVASRRLRAKLTR